MTLDYSAMTISFDHKDQQITLIDEVPAALSVCSTHLRRDISTNEVCELFLLSVSHNDDCPPQIQPSCVDKIFSEFSALFNVPSSFPPQRPADHKIVIQPRQRPITVRPYHYLHFQKGEISCLISQVLKDGVIQPSQSPFSSPVLLVRKKDCTWQFCVDYCMLNSVTICDSFPIPTIDELFDELHG